MHSDRHIAAGAAGGRTTRIVAVAAWFVAAAVIGAWSRALATPNCGAVPCPQTVVVPAHWNDEADVGQGKGDMLSATAFMNDITLAKDGGPQDADVGAANCEGGGTSRPINWPSLYAGTDCLSAHYINAGVDNQRRFDQNGENFLKGGCAPLSHPYDDLIEYLFATTGGLEQASGNGFPGIYHNAGSGGSTLANRAVQVQSTQCLIGTIPAGVTVTGLQYVTPSFTQGSIVQVNVGDVITVDTGGNQETVTVTAVNATQFQAHFNNTHAAGVGIDTFNAGYAINQNSPFAEQWLDDYMQGLITTPGTNAMGQYPWTGSCAVGTNNCFDQYALYVLDREFPSVTCFQGTSTSGAFLESDPSLTGGPYDSLPGLARNRNTFYAQAFHRSGGFWDNSQGKPSQMLLQVNTGDCEDNTAATYPGTYYLANANVIAINTEDSLVDSQTCNSFSSVNPNMGPEPHRYNARAIFALNSAFTFYADRKIDVLEQLCGQSMTSVTPAFGGCAGTAIPGGGGIFDLSLRYWTFGVAMLAWDPLYGFFRPDYYGSMTNVHCGFDVFAEEGLSVAGPDIIPGAYTAGPSGVAGCNTTTGFPAALATPAPGESGTTTGIWPLLVAGQCGDTTAGGAAYFTRGGVASRQFNQCWIRRAWVGPCGVIVNMRFTSGGTEDYSDSLVNAFHGSPFASYHHIMVITDPFDVEEGGSIDVTSYSSETIVRSKAASQTGAGMQCTQGVDIPMNGDVVVCEAEALIVFE